ncbi:MAG: hypothetical protein JW973_18605 [Bacteroidales bacterium]|nr:hypothetical protein [Bacteroidales bacterium]
MKTRIAGWMFVALVTALFVSCDGDDDDDRDKFIGTFQISETYTLEGGGSGTDNYSITIVKSSNKDQIIINNLGNTINVFGAQMSVIATVNGSALTIATQSISVGSYSITVSGSGNISNTLLTMNYNIVGQWSGQCQGFKQ